MIKKIGLFFCSTLFFQFLFSQVLFTYGKNPVSKQEFLSAFNKNKNTDADNSKALEDYLNLYINFKLKVQAAKDEGLDTLTSQRNELINFRSQIEPGFLIDEGEVNKLAIEAFERSLYNLHVSYVFIPFEQLSDSTKTLKSIQIIYNNIQNNFALIEQFPALKKYEQKLTFTDAGLITVFSLPYNLENIVYSLRPLEVSQPYKGKNGFYIFQVTDRQKAIVDKIKAAQILISLPPGSSAIEENIAKKKADSVYALLKKGSVFPELAKMVSDDRTTFNIGGVMEEFGVGRYSPEFESNVFRLKNENEISPPFKTEFGFHIVQLLHKTLISTNPADETNMAQLKQKVLLDERAKLAKDKFIEKAKKILDFKISEIINAQLLKEYTDSFILNNKKIKSDKLNFNTTLFSLKSKPVTYNDWLSFLNKYKSPESKKKLPYFNDLKNQFITNNIINYYRMHLAEFNKQFKQQLKEYAEGNLLFEIMERKVWSLASKDSIGLKKYYEKNKTKYKWGKSADVIIFTFKDDSMAGKLRSSNPILEDLVSIKSSFPDIQVDSGRFELNQVASTPNILQSFANLKQDTIITSRDTGPEHTTTMIKILKIYPEGEQRNFEQARGMIVNDYQGSLETAWVNMLRKKYPVMINKAVLNTILR